MSSNPERRLAAVLRQSKDLPATWKSSLVVVQNGHIVARLEPITTTDARDPVLIDLLSSWRARAADCFSSQFPVTCAGTEAWLTKQVLAASDRILFWIRGDHDGMRVGHLGLKHIGAEGNEAELANVVRGVANVLPGVMEASVRVLLSWAAQNLGLEAVSVRVFSHDLRAVRFCDRCGFTTSAEIPLVKLQEGSHTRWINQSEHPGLRAERRFLSMQRRCRQEGVRKPVCRTAA